MLFLQIFEFELNWATIHVWLNNANHLFGTALICTIVRYVQYHKLVILEVLKFSFSSCVTVS